VTSTFRSPFANPTSPTNGTAVVAGGPANRLRNPDATRRQQIAEYSHFIAEKRCFVVGDSIQDWLKAEQHIGLQGH
jgi:hypothetical protein